MGKIFDAVEITATYSDNRQELVRKDRGQMICFLDYVKGPETSLQLLLEHSSKFDVVGSEEWYQESEPNSLDEIIGKTYSFTATGKYHFTLPGNSAQDKSRIALRKSGGSSDVAEVSDFTTVADVSAALASKYFTWKKSGNVAFYGWYRVTTAAVAEQTDVTFSQPGSFYDVIGTAKALQFRDGANAGHYFWFRVTNGSNVQTAPSLVGTAHQVSILSADTSAQVATKFAAVIDALAGFVAPVPGASIVAVTNAVGGVATDATASGTAAAVLVNTQGVAAIVAGADPAQTGTGVVIDIAINATQAQVATATIAALASHGGGVIAGQPTKFRITNAVVGSVTDATAGNSGFSVTVSTQGIDAAGTVTLWVQV